MSFFGKMHTGKLLLLLGGVFALYAVAISLYAWNNSPNAVFDAWKGTPADPATFFTPRQLADSERLNMGRTILFFVGAPWEWLLYAALLATGIAARWRDALERLGWPLLVRFPLFVLLLDGTAFVWTLPLRVLGYRLSRAYGISTQPAAGWLRDKLVAFGVGYATLLAVSAVGLWIVSRGGRWQVKLWLLSVPFTVFMLYIQPVVIDPLYTRFDRLSDPALERRILDVAAKADIAADRVYEAHMAEKTNTINAYVNGIGPSLRIVLWDTALKRLTEPEIVLVMAHEMGHYVMHHLEWSAIGAVGSSFGLLTAGGWLYVRIVRRRGSGWGVRSPSDMAALPLALLLVSILSFAALPLSNAVSRQAEAAADAYALQLVGSAEGAVSMQQKLAVAALSDVDPPLLVRLFRDTHPSDKQRIVNAMKFAREHPP